MNSIVNLFLKKNKFNENSELFKSVLNSEINKIKNSKQYLNSLINKKLNDNEFILVNALLNKLKNELSSKKSLNKDESITKVENSIKQHEYSNLYYVNSQINSSTYNELIHVSYNSNALYSWNNNIGNQSIKQILKNTINNLQNLSSSLNTQEDVIMGIGGSIALVLAILGVFDFGTTTAVAIAIATVFNTVISGAFGQVINSISSLVQQIQSTLNTDNDLTVLSTSLTQTYKLIQLCISQLNNAINNLKSYTWVVGVNNAIQKLNSSINQLQSISGQISTEISSL